ncbi:HPP family protein [Candidatus Palauibacter sp.]|uniref:CBS domain-containing protein n=1 Tax=Candidatus Palauibacter sp. TaxID=3101350 RepID=UPI003B018CB7
MEVREIMTREVITAEPGMALKEAAAVIVRRRLRAMPVIDDEGHVLGMLTDRQLMTHFLPRLERARAGRPDVSFVTGSVRDIMERTVMCVNESEPLADVVRLMLDKEIERLPVVREGQLVGFLTRGDIIRRLLRRDVAELDSNNDTDIDTGIDTDEETKGG